MHPPIKLPTIADHTGSDIVAITGIKIIEESCHLIR